MSAKKCKIPKSFVNPVESKIPKTTILPNEDNRPEFRAEQIDCEGQWGWNLFDVSLIQELLQKIFESQKLTWQTLKNNGSHFVRVGDLSTEAQKRLIHIQKEDLDELFSLRLTGRRRLWGIKERNILWLLWWDPDHTVCPSPKKHT